MTREAGEDEGRMLHCALINLLTPLPPVRYGVLGQDAGGVGGAGEAQLADGE